MKVELDSIDDRRMNKAIQDLADASGTVAKDTLTKQSRLFCVDLAYNTRPIGKTAASGKKLKEAINGKVDFVYPSVGVAVSILKKADEKAARFFQRCIRKKNFTQAAAIMARYDGSVRWSVGPFDGGDLHRKERFKRRVGQRRIVTNKARVTEYKRARMAVAGFAKGGFATAARQLGGTRGIPGYATRQKTPGVGVVVGDGKNLTVSITNKARHIREALSQSGEERAIDHRIKSIRAVLKRMGDREFKKKSRPLR
jgi:hypothetical protein